MNKLEVDNVVRNFGSRRVLRHVSFSLESGGSLAVVGRNGSGKTTLLRILAGLDSASAGRIVYTDDDRRLSRAEVRNRLSYVGPELTLYEALTGTENLRFFATMGGLAVSRNDLTEALEAVGLGGRGEDYYGAYSSGMKQRLKYAAALLNRPEYLLLDEPTSNLDEEGKEIVSGIMARQKERGILVIATNEKEEYGFAEKLYRLDD